MQKPDVPAPAAAVSRKDMLLATFKERLAANDADSVKTIAKEAYAELARLRNLIAPHMDAFNAATEAMTQYLIETKREAINDSDFTIEFAPAKVDVSTDSAKLYDMLHALRIDGEPIPEDVLNEAAYIFTPPIPQPEKKTNLTKIKPLVKRFGAAVQECIDACVVRTPKPRVLIFAPKDHVLNGK